MRPRVRLLVELGCEELPHGACAVADANAARRRRASGCERQRLLGGDVAAYVSPRRIAVLAADVPAAPGGRARRAPRAAGERRAQRRRLDEGRRGLRAPPRRDGRTRWSCATASSGPSATPRRPRLDELAQGLVDALVDGLQIPKNMRWASETLRFARPDPHARRAARRALLPARVGRRGVGPQLRGHRFVGPDVELPRRRRLRRRARGRGRRRADRASARGRSPAALDAAADEPAPRGATPAACCARSSTSSSARTRSPARSARAHMELPDARARDGDAVAPALPAADRAGRLALPGLPDRRELATRRTTRSCAPATSACWPAGSTTPRSRWSRTSQRGLEAMAAALEPHHVPRAGRLAGRPHGAHPRAGRRARWQAAGRRRRRRRTPARRRGWPRPTRRRRSSRSSPSWRARSGAEYARAPRACRAPVAQAIGEQFLPDGAGGAAARQRARRAARAAPTSSTRS